LLKLKASIRSARGSIDDGIYELTDPVDGPVAAAPADGVELRDDGVLVAVGVALVQHVQLEGVAAAVDGVLARRVPVHLP
jgi:hypothetical protein